MDKKLIKAQRLCQIKNKYQQAHDNSHRRDKMVLLKVIYKDINAKIALSILAKENNV